KKVTIDDLEEIAIFRGSHLMTPADAAWFGAYRDNTLLGCCCAMQCGDTSVVYFQRDFVFKEYRRKGVYSRLFKERMEYSIKQGYKHAVAMCNENSKKVFKQYGFFEDYVMPQEAVVWCSENIRDWGKQNLIYLGMEI